MATYNVVLFADESDSTQQEYMTQQGQAITNAFSHVTVENVNSDDSRLNLYGKYADRVPAIIIFKNGGRMKARHAKLQHNEAVEWIRPYVGG